MVRVKVLKLAGETGLRLVGSVYELSKEKAKSLKSKGLVEIFKEEPVEVIKEEKHEIETKELKFDRQTKKRK